MGKHLKRKIVNRKGHSVVINSEVTVLRPILSWGDVTLSDVLLQTTKTFLQQPRRIADRTLKCGQFNVTK